MVECIFCKNSTNAKSIEHIVSESLGNTSYVMERGRVCDDCNARFSKFEGDALSGSVLLMERARFGIKTKKGTFVKGAVAGLKIEGHENFVEDHVIVTGLTEENFTEFDPITRVGKLKVQNFSKSAIPNTKLLLKTGLEALYTSRRKIYNNYNFDELRAYLLAKDNRDWPMVISDVEASNFESIPRFGDKLAMSKIHAELRFSMVDEDTLLYKFKYGAIPMVVNLLSRNLDWILPYQDTASDDIEIIFPEHFRAKADRTRSRTSGGPMAKESE